MLAAEEDEFPVGYELLGTEDFGEEASAIQREMVGRAVENSLPVEHRSALEALLSRTVAVWGTQASAGLQPE
ncbi:hypothetical protein PI124_g22811 [Phytophthora idaei]|nr:hypothetical protein PI125_g25022 [Phytophthora idaei]KAG3126370.1 hypothetical protein PI126_g22353 [Phytophthora idaei]KAG3232101.1 hypothetical protein PI124_g22811 [Phytophthora idaei]